MADLDYQFFKPPQVKTVPDVGRNFTFENLPSWQKPEHNQIPVFNPEDYGFGSFENLGDTIYEGYMRRIMPTISSEFGRKGTTLSSDYDRSVERAATDAATNASLQEWDERRKLSDMTQRSKVASVGDLNQYNQTMADKDYSTSMNRYNTMYNVRKDIADTKNTWNWNTSTYGQQDYWNYLNTLRGVPAYSSAVMPYTPVNYQPAVDSTGAAMSSLFDFGSSILGSYLSGGNSYLSGGNSDIPKALPYLP